MMGVLGWPPSEAWAATPFDCLLAIKGWKLANGGESDEYMINDHGRRVRKCTKADIMKYKELEKKQNGKR